MLDTEPILARKIGVVPSDIVNAAARLADAEGLESVTLASVAAELGIRSPSLYAHLDGLNGLHRQLALHAAAAMAAALRTAAANRRGIDALAAIANAYRVFARQHPGLYAAAQRAVSPKDDKELYHALAAVAAPTIQVLAAMGLEDEETIHLTRAFRAALHGFVTLEQIGGFGMPTSVNDSFHRLVDLLLTSVRRTSRRSTGIR